MRTMGTILVVIKLCSPVRVLMPVQGGRNAHGLLYLTAVRRYRRTASSNTARQGTGQTVRHVVASLG